MRRYSPALYPLSRISLVPKYLRRRRKCNSMLDIVISPLNPRSAHAHSVNHRHTTVMFSIGACISRLADATWIRTCEGVKRCAPGIGRVGEARVFCETGWLGNVPNDLADLSNPSLEHPNSLSRRLSPSDNAQSPSHLSETQTSNSPAALLPLILFMKHNISRNSRSRGCIVHLLAKPSSVLPAERHPLPTREF
jgi:hypothetical protein